MTLTGGPWTATFRGLSRIVKMTSIPAIEKSLIGANEKDTVFLTTSGRFETSKDKCLITSTGTYTVTGGTGAFANATGSGTISTETNLCAGTALGTFTGTISRPNSN